MLSSESLRALLAAWRSPWDLDFERSSFFGLPLVVPACPESWGRRRGALIGFDDGVEALDLTDLGELAGLLVVWALEPGREA